MEETSGHGNAKDAKLCSGRIFAMLSPLSPPRNLPSVKVSQEETAHDAHGDKTENCTHRSESMEQGFPHHLRGTLKARWSLHLYSARAPL